MRPPRTHHYGPLEAQEGDLHLPVVAHPPVVCLLHGGFWRMPHGREALTPLAEDLAARGFAVWNLEYRRLGASGGGWPGTLEDVAAGIDHLAALAAGGVDLDLDRVIVVGHSAGGHLALWAAGRAKAGLPGAASPKVRVRAAVGLAPLADLEAACRPELGRGAVAELLGGTPAEVPARYGAASPRALLPLGVAQLILHGERDEAVPLALSRGYARAAREAGDRVELVELAGIGHMDHVDPLGRAHAELCRRLSGLT